MKFRNLYITIDQDLFNSLETAVLKHNLYYDEDDNNKIMMDKAVFLIAEIYNQKSRRKGEVTPKGYIRIPSNILNLYLKKELKKYREFLSTNNFIKTTSYSKEKNLSRGYTICYFENKGLVKKTNKQEYLPYVFISESYEKYLIKSIDKNSKTESNKRSADRSTGHLTKWICEENIQIDWQNAFTFISENESLTVEQKEQYSYSVNRIRFHQWYYIRSSNDNRLHSNLTNLPSMLRKFIYHKNQQLVSLDIKSSQPFMLAGILNLIAQNRELEIEFIKKGLKGKDIKDRFCIVRNSISLTSFTIADFTAYQNLVCDKDIYSHIGNNLGQDFKETITSKFGYTDKFYHISAGHKIKKHFKSLRDYSKLLVLEYMYCSLESNERRIKEVKSILPSGVNNFIYQFKYCEHLCIPKNKRTKRQKLHIVSCKKLFSKFLQQLEAFLILDIITKELSIQYPQMFLSTIHDSIIVPIEYEIVVKKFLKHRLYEILGLNPEIKSEKWIFNS